jgi:hypothetical protein
MAVNNQIDLVCGLFEHALQKFDERGVSKLVLEDHEVPRSAVGDGLGFARTLRHLSGKANYAGRIGALRAGHRRINA